MGHVPVAKPSPIPEWRFPRRGLAIAFVLAGFVALIGVAVTTAYPTGSKVDDGPRWESVATFGELQAGDPVRVATDGGTIFLVKLKTEVVIALSPTSPHLGCVIGWRPDFEFDGRKGWFRDPCSGSTFDFTGLKAFGPSPRSMDRFETRVFGDDVQVRVGDHTLVPYVPPSQ